MKDTITCHPSEDVLTDCALDKVDIKVESHLAQCAQCREFIEDVRTISNEIVNLNDEEIPFQLHDKIMAITRKRNNLNVISFIQNWYKKPFFYGILTALFAIIVYAIFTILL